MVPQEFRSKHSEKSICQAKHFIIPAFVGEPDAGEVSNLASAPTSCVILASHLTSWSFSFFIN